MNPFKYGSIVDEKDFCNRKKEFTDLTQAIKNSERLFIYSERRLGKTSLIKYILKKLPRNQYISAYVDLWPTDGQQTFVSATAKAITESMATTVDSLLKVGKQFFGGLSPAVVVGEDGTPQIKFAVTPGESHFVELADILRVPGKIAQKEKRQVVIVFDEFQQILEYDDDNLVERTLRSCIQQESKVAYLFLGSRKHLIHKMVVDQSRPLYRAGGHYPIGPIKTEDWLPFIRQKFKSSNIKIDDEHIKTICAATGGHPFYTQNLCNVIWDLSISGKKFEEPLIKEAINLLLDRQSYAYTALWESFTLNQRRFLAGLAEAEKNIKVFSGEFINKNNLKSHSSVQKIIPKLLQRDIIDREGESFVILDRFFGIWISRLIKRPHDSLLLK